MDNKTTIVTGKVRFSYAHIFEPHAVNPGAEPKYSLSVIIPKSDKKTIAAINAAIDAAIVVGKESKWGGKVPKNLKNPLRDGDEDRDDEAYSNSMFFNCSSKRKPGVVDENVQPVLDADEVYSGCYGRVQVNFYPFSFQGNNGVAVGLQNVQKLEDGERLGGGGMSAEAAFGNANEEDVLG